MIGTSAHNGSVQARQNLCAVRLVDRTTGQARQSASSGMSMSTRRSDRNSDTMERNDAARWDVQVVAGSL